MRQVIYGGSAVCAYLGGLGKGDERFAWLLLAMILFSIGAVGLGREVKRFEALFTVNALVALFGVVWMIFVQASALTMLAVLSFLGTSVVGLSAFLFFKTEKGWGWALPGIVGFSIAAGLTVYLLFLG